MEIVNFPAAYSQVGARGVCPHCSHLSYFQPVTNAYADPGERGLRICNAAECQSCKKYVLVVGKRAAAGGNPYHLEACYPLGKPNDHVEDAVPLQIRPDFAEALRCQWIKAYKATVAMCGRVIQASAIQKGASPKKKLVEQIDELAAKGVITQPLKEMAHEIRLTRNVGVHPPEEDPLKDVSEDDADDLVQFTREFLHHVYVMPAKLEARRKKVLPAEEKPSGPS